GPAVRRGGVVPSRPEAARSAARAASGLVPGGSSMLAIHFERPPGAHARARHTDDGVAIGANVVAPEQFRDLVQQESRRHARYLSGLGLVCIGCSDDGPALQSLHEAVETETRRTDAVAQLSARTWAVLAVCASDRGVETLARRLQRVALEISGIPEEG